MATLNAFPLNGGDVSHTQGNGMDLGHRVAASLLMSSNLTTAPTRAERRKLTKKHFVLQWLCWKCQTPAFSGMTQREMKEQGQHVCVHTCKWMHGHLCDRQKSKRMKGRQRETSPRVTDWGYWWRVKCVLARMPQYTTYSETDVQSATGSSPSRHKDRPYRTAMRGHL